MITNKKYLVLVYSIFVFIVLTAVLFFVYKRVGWKNELEDFQKMEAKGKITYLKDLTRGHYDVKLSSKKPVPSLRIGWEVEKYNIQIGDSISKEANSVIVMFYKLENGVYKKCCACDISL